MLNRRGCGILLHPTSLPGPGGIGTMGSDARRFIDLLREMGMSYWQLLPLTPPACGNSPYSSFTAFGGNPLLIDMEQLALEGDLPLESGSFHHKESRVDFNAVASIKMDRLHGAASSFLAQKDSSRTLEFHSFCASTRWLHDYALFMALKRRFQGESWISWPSDASHITQETRQKYSEELGHEIAIQKYLQWQFSRQWQKLRSYANQRGITVIGDIPIFVAHDSADVWSHRELFLLDARGRSRFVAGVPPDYFSSDGQLWGNPHYNWELMAQGGYQWWIERFKSVFRLFDIVRIDHFRGFEAAWHVSGKAKTARKGEWVKGPEERLFDALHGALGRLPIIAEDLGVITPGVEALRDRYNYPGMKILQFAFGSGPSNPDLPHNHVKNGVVYTGTHDNETTRGWYSSGSAARRLEMNSYLGASGEDPVADLIRAALMSVSDTAVIPFQDILKLGNEARMNVPGTPSGNWEWRFSWDMLPKELARSVRSQLELYARAGQGGDTGAS